MSGMTIEQDGTECLVVGADGRILALFDGGSAATNRRHAEAWVRGEFNRDEYEEDLKLDHQWTGQHVLAGMGDKR